MKTTHLSMEYVKKMTRSKSESTHPESSAIGTGVEQMKAVIWQGGKTVEVAHVRKPRIQEPFDIIVKVTAASICPGFTTQVFEGDIPGMEKGQVLGREAVGIIDQVGSEIVKFKVGDRVAVSFVIACGECSYCKRQEYSCCNRTNDSKEFANMYGGWAPAAIFGYSRMFGNVPGSQAEYVRVPYGDVNCYKVPNAISDEMAVFASETVASGLHAAELGDVKQDDTVVIWGLGPIGLLAAEWCKLKGAKRVIGIDAQHDRLKFAHDKMKLEVVDRSDLNSSQVTTKLLQMLPEGGADVAIDACGYSKAQSWMTKLEKSVGMDKQSADVLKECFTVTRKYGHVAIIADYTGYADAFPIGHVMMKHLTLRAGQCPVQKYFKPVFDAMETGDIDPSVLISHSMSLDDAPKAYQCLYNKEEGYLKVLLTPHRQT
jgi:threonine dehydrogenase-like Zn-dependent dehydrogenase